MRRVISFILMLVIVLSLACPAFAATNSPADKAPTTGGGTAGTAQPKPHNSGSNPKTGDIIMTWVIVLAVSLIALVAVVMIYRKKFA